MKNSFKPGPDTVPGKLLAQVGQKGNAFNYYKGSWKAVSYEDFFSLAGGLSSFLSASGIKKGDRVAIVSENRHEWCAAYLSALAIGGVTVPIDPQLSPGEIKNILTDSGSKAAFVSSETEAHVREAVEGLGIRLIDLDSELTLPHPLPSREGKVNQPSPLVGEGGGEEGASSGDLASLVYTSGTTGKPKAVMLTHGNLASDIGAVADAGIIRPGDNLLSMLPLHHTYALMCTFLVPVSVGAEVTYPPTLKGPELIKAIKEREVTIIIGVPRIIESLRNAIIGKLKALPFPVGLIMSRLLKASSYLRRKWDIKAGRLFFGAVHKAFGRQLRFITSGGARLEPGIMGDMEALGFTVIEGYGLTETSPVVTFNPPSKRKPGSAGRPLVPAEIKIVNPSETGEGEIAVKGPMVMEGYFNNPKATSDVLKDGPNGRWFLTGDLGYIDPDGYLFVTGRAKDVIVLSSGKNIYPEDVEREYGKIPLIKEICVLGRRDRLEAVIVPDPEYLKKEKIGNINEALKWEINSVSMKLPPYMRLMGYTIYPEPLPKTPLGKFRRFLIKDIGAGKPAPQKEDKALMGDDAGRRIAGCLGPLLDGPRAVQLTDSLELDLGLDSLKRIELVVSLEKEFSLRLPEGFASEVRTVSELVGRIKGAVSHPLMASEAVQKAEAAPPPPPPSIEEILRREPPDDIKRASGLRRLYFERPLRYVFRVLLKFFFRLFYGLEVKGIEDIPEPPFIIAPNHASYLDGFAVAASLPAPIFRLTYYQGFQRYFRGRLTSFFARLAHVILIDPETYLEKALELSASALRAGNCLVIFPEGGRSFDGGVMPFKKGIGMLAMGLHVPVVPLLISGTFEALPRGSRMPRRAKVRLVFGPPLSPVDIDLSKKPEGVNSYQYFADMARERVKALGGR